MAYISDSVSSFSELVNKNRDSRIYTLVFNKPGVFRIGSDQLTRLAEFNQIDAYIWGAGGGDGGRALSRQGTASTSVIGIGGGAAFVKVSGIAPAAGADITIAIGERGGRPVSFWQGRRYYWWWYWGWFGRSRRGSDNGHNVGGGAGRSWKQGGYGTPVDEWFAGGSGGGSKNADLDASAGGGGGGATALFIGGELVALAGGGGGGGGHGDDRGSGGRGSAGGPGQVALSIDLNDYAGIGQGAQAGGGALVSGGGGGGGGGGLQGGTAGVGSNPGGDRGAGGTGGAGGYSFVDPTAVTGYEIYPGNGSLPGGTNDVAYQAGWGGANQMGRVVLVFRRLPHVWVKIAGATGGPGGIGGRPGSDGRYFGAGGGGAGVHQVGGSTVQAAYRGGNGYPGYVRLSYYQKNVIDQKSNAFRLPGTTRFIVPAGVEYIDIQATGGGGGGGYSYRQNPQLAGGGGGSADYVTGNIAVTTGQAIDIVIGAGGTGAFRKTDLAGNRGGNTRVTAGATVFLAVGGFGGNSATFTVPGAGGAGGGTLGVAGTAGNLVPNGTLTVTGRKRGDATGGTGGNSSWPTAGNQIWRRVDKIHHRSSFNSADTRLTGRLTTDPENPNLFEVAAGQTKDGWYTRNGGVNTNPLVSRQWWIVIDGEVVYNSTARAPDRNKFAPGTFRGHRTSVKRYAVGGRDPIMAFDLVLKVRINRRWREVPLIYVKRQDQTWHKVFANASTRSLTVSSREFSTLFDGQEPVDLIDVTPRAGVLSLRGDFTIELWMFQLSRNEPYNTIFELNDYRAGILLRSGSQGGNDFYINDYNFGSISANVALRDWNHMAITRQGTHVRLFVDGTMIKEGNIGGVINPMNEPLRIGASRHTALVSRALSTGNRPASYRYSFAAGNGAYIGFLNSYGIWEGDGNYYWVVNFPATESYYFAGAIDNYGTLYIDDIAILNIPGFQTEYNVTRTVTAGPHVIRIYGVNTGGPASIGAFIRRVSTGGIIWTTRSQVGEGRQTVPGTSSQAFHGYISNFRVLQDQALYTVNFTPPDEPFSQDDNANTRLLLLAGTTASDLYKDLSVHPGAPAAVRPLRISSHDFSPFGKFG